MRQADRIAGTCSSCSASGFEARPLLGAVTGFISTVPSAPNQWGHALAKELVHLPARQRPLPTPPTGATVGDLDQPSAKRDPGSGSIVSVSEKKQE